MTAYLLYFLILTVIMFIIARLLNTFRPGRKTYWLTDLVFAAFMGILITVLAFIFFLR